MKVAAYQAPLLASGSMEVVGLIREQVDWCESAGVEILCCPEGILGGLADYATQPNAIAINVEDGQLNAILAPLASHSVTTIVGFTEVDQGGRLYNSAAVFHKGSVVGLYRKLYPAINKSVYEAGDKMPVFTVGKLTFGILICLDSNFHEPARLMAAQGATALFVPTNNGLPPTKTGPEIVAHARNVDIARAVENSVSVIRADVAGRTSELVSYGSSGIVDAHGMVLRSARRLRAGLVVADIETMTKKLLSAGALWFTLFLIVPWVPAQQAPPGGRMRLNKIVFTGLQRHSQEEAIAASGLQIGQLVDVPTLDAAAQRLFDSGLFKKLSYRYRTNGDQAVVTFETEEEKGVAAPVVFDNFVWFSDEELLSAVRRQIPSFARTANNSATNGITKALQQLLQDRKIAGRVEYAPSADLSTGNVEHVFTVEGVKVPICNVHFSGATAIKESDLIKHTNALLAGDYKRTFVSTFAKFNLIPIYRERGYLRASFGEPTVMLASDTTSDCKGGVTVTLPVEEGPIYTWRKAEWIGNTDLTNPELEAALEMKSGEIANASKIDKRLGFVEQAFGRKGHLSPKLKATPVFDDGSRSVTYKIEIQEGPQYRMGTLKINGLSESTTNRLLVRWKLKSRDVYDTFYLKEFLKQEMTLDPSEPDSPPKTISSEIKVDREKLIVDVTISVK